MKDPINRLVRRLTADGRVVDAESAAAAERRARVAIAAASEAALAGPRQPARTEALVNARASGVPAAIRATLARGDARRRRVLVLGEDVAVGGPRGATTGLQRSSGRACPGHADQRGRDRGWRSGLRTGPRPMVEIMFIDFVTLALDQLVNQAAKAHYMSGGQLRCRVLGRPAPAGAAARSTRRASRRGWRTFRG